MPDDNPVAIAIDLGGTRIKGGLIGPDGALPEEPLSRPSRLATHPGEWLAAAEAMITDLLAASHSAGRMPAGIGFSTTIEVDPTTGCFRPDTRPSRAAWSGFPIAGHLEQRFGLPVVIENDGLAAAWGEHRAGIGRGYRIIAQLMLGTGIGGGVILDHDPSLDPIRLNPGFGHMSINFYGPRCSCGQNGCWELYVSSPALQRLVREERGRFTGKDHLPDHPGGEDIYQAALDDDPLARQAFARAGIYLGIGLVNIANLFEPEAIILGGGLSAAFELLAPPAQALLASRLPLRPEVALLRSSLGPYSALIGAGLLLWEALEGPG